MKTRFPGHYRPSPKDFKAIWDTCSFAFDANTLLNMYRYSPALRNDFLGKLGKLGARLWLPYQAAMEYQANRLEVIANEELYYGALAKELSELSSKTLAGLKSKFPRHTLIQIDDVLSEISKAAEKASVAVEKAKEKHPKYEFDSDQIRDTLTRLFSGPHLGAKSAPPDALARAKARFSDNRPPGLRDKSKGGDAQYGDAIIWIQLLEQAKATKKSMVFVTDDRKDDWWLIHGGKTLAPLPALVEEMAEYAGVAYYQYAPDQFLKQAGEFLNEKATAKSLAEVREVSRTFNPLMISMEPMVSSDVAERIRRALGPSLEVNSALQKMLAAQTEALRPTRFLEELTKSMNYGVPNVPTLDYSAMLRGIAAQPTIRIQQVDQAAPDATPSSQGTDMENEGGKGEPPDGK